MTIAERITIYSRMNNAIDKAEADSYRETDDLQRRMHDALHAHENYRKASYDHGFHVEFKAELDRLYAIYADAADAYYEARRQAVSRVDAFFDWLSSAELVDAIPPGDPCTVEEPLTFVLNGYVIARVNAAELARTLTQYPEPSFAKTGTAGWMVEHRGRDVISYGLESQRADWLDMHCPTYARSAAQS